MEKIVVPNAWGQLRRLTPARIALGRTGASLPTKAHLEFQLAHALARDAVHHPFDANALRAALEARGHEVVVLHSAAADRRIYLQRPDLGRRLDGESRGRLQQRADADGYDAALVVADGLSPLAIFENAVPLLDALLPRLAGWRLAPLVVVEQGRVAVADEVGELLGAGMAAILIGERPGLSSPDSMGIYLTANPRVGTADADRNCISNVRRAGLGYDAAAGKLSYLMTEARRRGYTGVRLKDEADAPPRLAGPGNFLLDGD